MEKKGPTAEEWVNPTNGNSGYYYFDQEGLPIDSQTYSELLHPPESDAKKKVLEFLRTLTDDELNKFEYTLEETEILIYQVRKERGIA